MLGQIWDLYGTDLGFQIPCGLCFVLTARSRGNGCCLTQGAVLHCWAVDGAMLGGKRWCSGAAAARVVPCGKV